MHLKRNDSPVNWPIPRKGTKYVAMPKHNKTNGIPVLILLRDLLKIGKTRKEIKNIIHNKKIRVNDEIIDDEKFPLILFDLLGVGDKNYKLILENKKFKLEETKEKGRISKIIGKKILPGKKIQINLNDGRNFIIKEKMNVGDSVVIKDKKIEKILSLKPGAEVIVIAGGHLGEEGKVDKIDGKIVTITLKHGKLNMKNKSIMVK